MIPFALNRVPAWGQACANGRYALHVYTSFVLCAKSLSQHGSSHHHQQQQQQQQQQ